MKRYILLLVVLLCGSTMVWGQAPKMFSYQATVRDGAGELVKNRDVTIAFTILQGTKVGDLVFHEEQRAKTNSHGVLSVTIGERSAIGRIHWQYGPYYLKVEIDPNGGKNFTISATQELLSVPYAMNVALTDSVVGFDFKEKQVLSKSHDTIFLTGGSYVILPTSFDGGYQSLHHRPTLSMFVNDAGYLLQESQVLSKNGDTIFLTGGSYVVLPEPFGGDYDSLINKPTLPTRVSDLINDAGYLTEEVQVLSISNDTIYLTGGSFVKLPARREVQTMGNVAGLDNRAGDRQLKNVQDPTDRQDAVTLHYMDSVIWAWVHPEEDYGTHNVLTVSECNRYNWHGNYYTEDGVYTYSYANGAGHYSVDTLKLTIRNSTYRGEHRVARGSYRWHNTEYTSTGTYRYQYYNQEGCRSVDTLYLRLIGADETLCESNREAVDTAEISVCGEAKWYGQRIRATGEYSYNLGPIALGGCDSVVKVKVNILSVYQMDTSVRANTAFTWRGQTYTEQGDYGDTLVAANGCDSIYTLHLMMGGNSGIGALKGLFSVSAGLQVRFSQGNLQYLPAGNLWRFASNQYDVLNMRSMNENSSDWVDLFGWATSGYHDEEDTLCVNYKPWAYEHVHAKRGTDAFSHNQYGYGPSKNRTDTNMTGGSRNYDWGVYNAITNGGNGTDLWRTMSREEWNYLLYERTNASQLKGIGMVRFVPLASGDTVEFVCGNILLPDDWVCPQGLTFDAQASTIYGNIYSIAEWRQMEEAGAVLLPIRDNIRYNGYENYEIGSYWTQSSCGVGGAYALNADRDTLMLVPNCRAVQSCVRLVQNKTASGASQISTSMDTVIVSAGNLSWNGNTYTETGNYAVMLRNSKGGDSVIYLNFIKVETGELNGVFSIDEHRTVKFSKGNLQYHARADVWKFSEEQYGCVGDGNNYIDEKYNGWIDQYGWATSGYHDPTDVLNLHYQPWVVTSYSDPGYGPSEHMSDGNLINTSANYDWGVYNVIANGGNQAGQWRTLSYTEMSYLLDGRPNASLLRAVGKIHGVVGAILLPDGWVAPAGIVVETNVLNQYDDAQWDLMERAGAVFMPMSGYRIDRDVIHYEQCGKYWLSTRRSDGYCFADLFGIDVNNSMGVGWDWSGWGFNVRLVKDN